MTGALLINLGTPDSPEPEAVKRYLEEFLMDPFVVDIPGPFRWLLVHGIILRTRPARSAAQYAKIWTKRGSPLLFHTQDLTALVQQKLGPEYRVAYGMRYGRPSLGEALRSLTEAGVNKIVALPLYPQYSQAATESSHSEVAKWLAAQNWKGNLSWVEDFYEDPRFIEAAAEIAEEKLSQICPDFVIFSFHGLPERQIRKTDSSQRHCLKSVSCCEKITETNRLCYRAQCFATARALASRLRLDPEKWKVSFQSRLGRTPWIQPFTDHLYEELPKKGIRRVAVLCPSFVADCLETLEEVQIRGQEQFRAAGGEKLDLIPCVNSSARWAEGVASLLRDHLSKD